MDTRKKVLEALSAPRKDCNRQILIAITALALLVFFDHRLDHIDQVLMMLQGRH